MQHELNMLRAENSKVARIRAKQQIKIARAESKQYNESRMVKYGAIVACAAIMSISGCTAVVWGVPEDADAQREIVSNQKYQLCVMSGGDWDNRREDCDTD